MTDKLQDQWTPRDYPVLLAAARRMDGGEPSVQLSALAADTGLPLGEVQNAARALERRGFLTAVGVRGSGAPTRVADLTGAAYFATGLHPDGGNMAEQLISALQQAADQTDGEESGALRESARSLRGVPGAVLGTVLSAWITHQTGIS